MAKILIAEDSPDIRALVRMLLETEGHEVTAVTDGREAVAAARESRPELILMDLSLPVMSGWEATRHIRSDPTTAQTPILALTAHAMQGDRERAMAAGCDGFIPKPIDEETFAPRVVSALAARRVMSGEPSVQTSASRGEDLPGIILVVDDQPEIAGLLKGDLEADGHQVLVANGMVEAISLFQKEPRVELAVIDIMLGGDSGYTLTEMLSAQSPDYIPVLLVTAGTIDRQRGYAVGADDFIGKPIDTVELRARSRSLIRMGRLIREQRRMGRERSEAYRKLSELDRLKSDFLSTVSHELRTPLNTIILLAHQIEKKSDKPEEAARQTRDARLLRDAAESLRQMINNILDLAKLEAGQRDLQPQAVDLVPFLHEVADLLEPQARAHGLELHVEPHSDLPPGPVHLDREKLFRVLVNLLSNAVKYTQRGRVVLRARPWQESITFEVEDTGVGIPAGLIGAAFEPFRQIQSGTVDAPRGTGLGLTISKQLVEMMGGDLILESQEGRGTRVTLTIPQLTSVAAPAPLEDARRKPTARPGAPAHPRVLIVEDDQSSRYGLASLLASEGYEVREAGNLAEADEILKQDGLGAMILDITLPDGDGAVWLSQKGARGLPLPPVLALTGVTADEDTRRISAAGALQVLTKPLKIAELLALLREATGGANNG